MIVGEHSDNFRDIRVRTHRWGGIEVQAIRLESLPGKTWHQLSSDRPMLSIVVRQTGGCCEARSSLEDRPDLLTRQHRQRTGHISVIPSGASIWGYSEDIACVDEVRIILDPKSVREITEREVPDSLFSEPTLMFSDEPLHVLGAFIAFNEDDIACFSLLGDSIATSIVARFVGLDMRSPSEDRRFGLSKRQLRLVTEFIRDNLAEQIRLADLARLVSLSPSQFGRAFKTSTGKTPHKWHLEARIKRAISLMSDPRQRLVEVALETGFAEQSHFTRIFNSVMGISPSAWRHMRH